MENLTVSLNAVLPIFILLAVGYAAKRFGLLTAEDVPFLNRISFRIFMPCMLFYDIYCSDISTAVHPKLVLFCVAMIFLAYGVSLGAALLCTKKRDRRGVLIQGMYRTNFLVVGIPVAVALGGAEAAGPAAVCIAVIVPIYNVLAVVTLSAFAGEKPELRSTLRSILTNPLIIGSVLGMLCLICGLRLPAPVESAVESIGRVGSPLQLFALGAFFRFGGLRKYARELLVCNSVRLVLIPALVTSLAVALGFRGAEFAIILGCFSASNAVASFTMAQQMGGDAELAGDIVVTTSALCSPTLFVWALLFKSLGIM